VKQDSHSGGGPLSNLVLDHSLGEGAFRLILLSLFYGITINFGLLSLI
jgi:hypothetical protein